MSTESTRSTDPTRVRASDPEREEFATIVREATARGPAQPGRGRRAAGADLRGPIVPGRACARWWRTLPGALHRHPAGPGRPGPQGLAGAGPRPGGPPRRPVHPGTPPWSPVISGGGGGRCCGPAGEMSGATSSGRRFPRFIPRPRSGPGHARLAGRRLVTAVGPPLGPSLGSRQLTADRFSRKGHLGAGCPAVGGPWCRQGDLPRKVTVLHGGTRCAGAAVPGDTPDTPFRGHPGHLRAVVPRSRHAAEGDG
jgi:hypothetical protein